MNEIILREYHPNDIEAVKNIFNYFGKESFACYNDVDINLEEMEKRMADVRYALVYELYGEVIGFGYVSYYKKFPNFDHAGVLTYLIFPEYTGKGLGSKLLNRLFEVGRDKGITNFIAHISSKNNQSLNFHNKMGFTKVGEIKNIAKKFGEMVNIVWVQKEFAADGDLYE